MTVLSNAKNVFARHPASFPRMHRLTAQGIPENTEVR